jgi:hypothetical protein
VALPGFALLYRRADGEVVIEVRGELDTNTAPELREGLAHLIDEQDDLSVVIDLRDLESSTLRSRSVGSRPAAVARPGRRDHARASSQRHSEGA